MDAKNRPNLVNLVPTLSFNIAFRLMALVVELINIVFVDWTYSILCKSKTIKTALHNLAELRREL